MTARTGGARFVVAARFARRVQRSAVFAGFARGAVRIRSAFDFFAAAFAVSQPAVGACALFTFGIGRTTRVGFTRVFAMVARLAVRIGRTARRYTVAVAVRDLSRFAGSACRIRRAGNAFRIRRRGALALFARGASRIVGAFERRTVAFAVGQLTRRARIFARAVVARFAGFALAQRRIPLTARFTALFTRRALASAVVVGNGISRTVACRVGRFARRTRTSVFVVFLSVGTRRVARTDASALAVRNFRTGASAAFARFATRAFAVVAAFVAVGAGRRRAFANVVVRSRYGTFGRRTRTRRIGTNGFARTRLARRTRRTIRVFRTGRKIL